MSEIEEAYVAGHNTAHGEAQEEIARLRAALAKCRRLIAQLIVAENASSLNGNVTIPKQTLPATVYDDALAAANQTGGDDDAV